MPARLSLRRPAVRTGPAIDCSVRAMAAARRCSATRLGLLPPLARRSRAAAWRQASLAGTCLCTAAASPKSSTMLWNGACLRCSEQPAGSLEVCLRHHEVWSTEAPEYGAQRASQGLQHKGLLGDCLSPAPGMLAHDPLSPNPLSHSTSPACLPCRYDRQSNRWLPGPSLHRKRFALGGALLDGAIYAVGGFDGCSYLACVERLDPRTDRCGPGARGERTMPCPLPALCPATFLPAMTPEYTICLAADWANGIECCDVVTSPLAPSLRRSWELLLGGMAGKRGGHAVAAVGGCLYALGGFDGVQAIPHCEAFEPRVSRGRPGRHTEAWLLAALCHALPCSHLPCNFRLSCLPCLPPQANPPLSLPGCYPAADQHLAGHRRHERRTCLRQLRLAGPHRAGCGRAAERHAGVCGGGQGGSSIRLWVAPPLSGQGRVGGGCWSRCISVQAVQTRGCKRAVPLPLQTHALLFEAYNAATDTWEHVALPPNANPRRSFLAACGLEQ